MLLTERRRAFWIAALLLLGGVVLPDASAIVSNPSQKNGVDPFYGSFSTEIPIEVPPFHGLEPQLMLRYGSGGSNGWLGVGWSLGGVSAIQRVGPNRSKIWHAHLNQWILDGAELIECTDQGGSHCTRTQSFARIQRNHDLIVPDITNPLEYTRVDNWVVSGTNGVKSEYSPVIDDDVYHGKVNRYVVHTTTDPHGNQVHYDYWCDGDQPELECYVERIRYNGNEITFHSELRPDTFERPFEMLTWFNFGEGRMRYRLKSVSVRVGDELARAYALEYDQSPVNGRSRLVAVQRFGTDASIDLDGTVSGGTALPAQRHEYSGDDGPLLAGTSDWGDTSTTERDRSAFADFNGDGFADHVVQDTSGGNSVFRVGLSNGNGFDGHEAWGSHGTGYVPGQVNYADANGDGRADLIWHDFDGRVLVSPSLGDRFADPQDWTHVPYRPFRLKLGDVDGDGQSDLVYIDDAGAIHIDFSLGDHFADTTIAIGLFSHQYPDAIRLLDMNRDGRVDLVEGHLDAAGCGFCVVEVHRSTGDTFDATATIHSVQLNQHQTRQFHFADADGDGYPELFGQSSNNFIGSNSASVQLPGNRAPGNVRFVDLTHDGKADIVHITEENDISLYASTGTGFEAAVLLQNHGGNYENGSLQFSDTNGDGRADLLFVSDDSIWVNPSFGDRPDLMIAIDNGAGGRTEVGYAPSTQWWTGDAEIDQYLPIGFVTQTVASATTYDGRGSVGRTDYVYAGGLWSDQERRFLGFRKVTGVIDVQGNYTETYYHQHDGCISKPEETYFYTNDGLLMSFSDFVYTPEEEVVGPPFTSLLIERWDFECQEATSKEECRKSLLQFTYDEYGNVVSTYEYGDFASDGDERTHRRTYTPNTDAYITGYPATEEVYEGIVAENEPGTLVEYREFLYDGASDYSVPPTQGRVTTKRVWNSQTGGFEDWNYGYDTYGNLVSERDPRGGLSTRTFDDIYHLYPTSETNALEHTTSRDFDYRFGQVIYEEDPNGLAMTTTFDVLGRRIASADSEGKTIRYEHHDLGDPDRQHVREIQEDGSPEGLWVETYQDGLGREYKQARKGGFVRETEYFAVSQRKSGESYWHHETEPAYFSYYQYDNAQRLQRTIHPDGNSAEIIYGVGVEIHVDENGNEKMFRRDVYGRVVQIGENDGSGGGDALTTYMYDALDRLTFVIDADENVTSIEWDSLGNRVEICEPNTGCSQSTYEPGGLLSTQTDAKGQVISFLYDELGRVKAKQRSEGDAFEWFYDEAGHGASLGQMTRVVYPEGSRSYRYYPRGEVETETTCVVTENGEQCVLQQNVLDELGRLKVRGRSGESLLRYYYDEIGQLDSVTGFVDDFEWTATGRLRSITYANGVTSQFEYDPERQWMESAEVTGPGGQAYYQATYGYDAKALVKSMASATDPVLNVQYQYDDLDRLLAVTGAEPQQGLFAYDALGNMTYNSSFGQYDYRNAAHPHAVTRTGGRNYKYDANGNMIEVWKPIASGGCGMGKDVISEFTWDSENRLVYAETEHGSVSFGYDVDGERVRRSSGNSTTYFFGGRTELEVDGNSSAYRTYTYIAGMLISRREFDGERVFYHHDHLGSPKLITDEAGDVVSRFAYNAYGEEIETEGDVEHHRGYTGQQYDEGTGLVYMGARYYDPRIGRFLSADSIVPDANDPQALNRYSYVYNNPISNVDPTGHEPVSAALAAAAIFIGEAAAAVGAFMEAYGSYVAIAGMLTTATGVATGNPLLIGIGTVMTGFAMGFGAGGWEEGLRRAAIAGLSSRSSPLDPGKGGQVNWLWKAMGRGTTLVASDQGCVVGIINGCEDAGAKYSERLRRGTVLSLDENGQAASSNEGVNVIVQDGFQSMTARSGSRLVLIGIEGPLDVIDVKRKEKQQFRGSLILGTLSATMAHIFTVPGLVTILGGAAGAAVTNEIGREYGEDDFIMTEVTYDTSNGYSVISSKTTHVKKEQ